MYTCGSAYTKKLGNRHVLFKKLNEHLQKH